MADLIFSISLLFLSRKKRTIGSEKNMEDDYVAIKGRKAEELLKKIEFTNLMPNSIIDIKSRQELEKMIKTYPNSLIIIDFWAEWCMPCKAFGPHFEAIQREYYKRGEPVIFLKVNIDDNPDIAEAFDISAVPTTAFLLSNKLVYKNMGLLPAESFKMLIEKIREKLNI